MLFAALVSINSNDLSEEIVEIFYLIYAVIVVNIVCKESKFQPFLHGPMLEHRHSAYEIAEIDFSCSCFIKCIKHLVNQINVFDGNPIAEFNLERETS